MATMRSVRIIKQNQRNAVEHNSAAQAGSSKNKAHKDPAREVFSTVSSWVRDFQQREREARLAAARLVWQKA